MSNKTSKVEADVNGGKNTETKNICYRLDCVLDDAKERTAYMIVTGVPKELPLEMEDTVRMAAEQQFASVIKVGGFIEFYSLGGSAKTEKPVFYNLAKIATIKITSVTKVE